RHRQDRRRSVTLSKGKSPGSDGGPPALHSRQHHDVLRAGQERGPGAGPAGGPGNLVGRLSLASGRGNQALELGLEDRGRQGGVCRGGIREVSAEAVAGQSRLVAGQSVWRVSPVGSVAGAAAKFVCPTSDAISAVGP